MKKTKFTELISSDISTLRNQPVAIIGGGGKSTLMLKLSRELNEHGLKVIISSTTKFQPPQNIALILQRNNGNYISEIGTLLRGLNTVAFGSEYYKENRVTGVDRYAIADVTGLANIVLIEADGSRQRSLKTHKEFEPVIPSTTCVTIVVVGADIVGKPLNEDTVHRAQLFAEKWQTPFGAPLTPELITRELLSPYSYLKNIPINSKISFFINKSDKNYIGGKLLAERLMRSCDHRVFLGSLKKNKLWLISHAIEQQ